MPTNSTKKPISAPDKEKVNVIRTCVSEYFSIEQEQLSMSGRKYSDIRRYCFYLISINTHLSDDQISELFNRDRTQVVLGRDYMLSWKKTYTHTLHTLRDLVDMCNKFTPKQFQWVIKVEN